MKKAGVALAALMMVYALSFAPVTYADKPTVVQSSSAYTGSCPASGTCLIGFLANPVTKGDMIATAFQVFSLSLGNGSGSIATDTLGSSWSSYCYSNAHTFFTGISIGTCIYYASAAASGASDSISIPTPGSTNRFYQTYELSNTLSTGACTSGGIATTDSGVANIATVGSCPWTASSAFLIGSPAATQSATGGWVAGTGFNVTQACFGGLFLAGACEISLPAGGTNPSNPTTFPIQWKGSNIGTKNFAEVGLALVGSPSFVIIPCTWFQQQCWWYPALFYGLYLGMFAMVATKGGAEGRGRTYLMLAALNMASMAQTAMGLLTPVVPLLLITLTVAYAVRFRNR